MKKIIPAMAACLLLAGCVYQAKVMDNSPELFSSPPVQKQHADEDSHPGKFYTIEKEYKDSNVDGYNLYIPNSCTSDSKRYPLIVFLQGGNAVGGKVDGIYNWELPKELRKQGDLNSELNQLRLDTFVFLMPHISQGQFYENADAIGEVIDEVIEKYNVDEGKVYLTGLSRGGHGTWGLASRMPNQFAAVAPICGRPYGIIDFKALTSIPIWTAHNTGDPIVDHEGTIETVRKIEDLSGKKFHRTISVSEVEYKTNDRIFISNKKDGHNAWAEVYDEVNFYKWLLRFHRED
jgi:predicted peptidase